LTLLNLVFRIVGSVICHRVLKNQFQIHFQNVCDCVTVKMKLFYILCSYLYSFVILQIGVKASMSNVGFAEKVTAKDPFFYPSHRNPSVPFGVNGINSHMLSNIGQPIRLKPHQNTHDPYDDKLAKRVIKHAKRKQNPYKPKSFWQIYADNVRQFHKGFRHRNHYPNKKQPSHKKYYGRQNYNTRQSSMSGRLNSMVGRISSGWNDFTSSVLNHMYSIYYTYEDRKGIEKPSHQFAKDVSKRTWLSSPSENRYYKRRWI